MDQWTNGPMDKKLLRPFEKKNTLEHWIIGPLVQWSIGPLVPWSIGPLVECQMSTVNMVKLLSERTSGVPPVIFQIKLRKAASCLKVNYTMYFQPPLWVHFRVLIGQKCWLNIALQVTSHRKYPFAILHGLVIVGHIPSLIGPDHLTIGQTSSVPTWVLIGQNSECCLNIVLHITFSHYLNTAQYSNISILHCT